MANLASTPELPEGRRHLIAGRLAAGHSVVASELAQEFGLSEDAIRRDLRSLAAEGLCRRVYGGAVPISGKDRPLAARLHDAGDRKSALAKAAAKTIQPGELVFLDAGSSNLALVEFLPEDAGLTIATNSVDIAAAVLRRQDLQLLMVGGQVDPHGGGCVDTMAVETISSMRFDRCFLGVCALSLADGIMASHFSEACFKRVLLQVSRRCCALVTHDKLQARAPHCIGQLAKLQLVVLEQGADMALVKALGDAGVEVIQVEAGL
jgi:DeoR/GlpR family transcriptional regulator of sugar metabolism